MKNNVFLLLKLQMMRVLNPALFSGNRDKKRKRKTVFAVIGIALLSVLMMVYSGLIAYGYIVIGAGKVLPRMMMGLCSLVLIMLTFLKSGSALFGGKDFDQVMSLPVKTRQIVTAKIISVYLVGVVAFVVFFVPAVVLLFVLKGATFVDILWLVLMLFAAPVLPTIVSLMVGTLIAAVTSRFRYSQIFTIFLYVVFLAGMFVWTGKMATGGDAALINFGMFVSGMIGRIYPPAAWAAAPLEGRGYVELAGFLLLSGVVAVLFTAVVSRYYLRLNSALASLKRRQSKKVSSGKKATVFAALFRKEWKRLSTCTIYALNTTVGGLFMVLAGIAVLFATPQGLEIMLEIPGLAGYIKGFVPITLGLFAAMNSTTAASLSLEGHSRWVLLSLPVAPMEVFRAKIALNLAVCLPCVFVSGICFCIKFHPDFWEGLLFFLVPAVYSFFSSVFGMWANVKFPSYDWTHEQQAVKNSMSVMVTIFGGMALGIAPLMLSIRFMARATAITLAFTGVAFVITVICYEKLKHTRLYL